MTFKQSLYQTECDLIGLEKTSTTNKGKMYAVEIAYHRNGLHYNKAGLNNSINKVTSKLIRTAFCIFALYKNIKAEIIFASPIANMGIVNAIDLKINALNRLAKIYKLNYTFRNISGIQGFKLRIIDPVFIMCKGVNDSSEMFLRSLQLLEVLGSNCIKTNLINPSSFDEFGNIGEIANKALRSCLRNKTITRKIITGLKPLIHSSKLAPIVKVVPIGLSHRYYKTPIRTKSGDYYLCNHWFANKKFDLINYIISLL